MRRTAEFKEVPHASQDHSAPMPPRHLLCVRTEKMVSVTSGSQSNGGVASGDADSGNPIKVGGKASNTAPSAVDGGDRVDAWMGLNGQQAVMLANPAGGVAQVGYPNSDGVATAAAIGMYALSVGLVWNGATLDRIKKPNATSRILTAAADTNATSAKASAGNVHHIAGYNAAAALRYLKLYNKASAPTVGTDTPLMTLALPGQTAFEFSFPDGGRYFSTGIAYGLTTGVADNDTGALTSGDVLGLNVSYS